MLRVIVIAVALIGAPEAAAQSAAAADLPIAPKPLTRVMPVYPPQAYYEGLTGVAAAELTIDDDGAVQQVRLISESPLDMGFGAAALESVKDWTFPQGREGRYRVRVVFVPEPTDLTPEEIALGPAIQPVPISRMKLKYPQLAIEAEMNGDVKSVLIIGETGDVLKVRIVEETPTGYGFAKAAETALKTWKFQPGNPGFYTVTQRYRLGDPITPPDLAYLPEDLKPAPEPSTRTEPSYPEAALRAGQQGDAEIAIYVNDNGKVTNAAILSETPEGHAFGGAALKAVIRWRFRDTPPGFYRVAVPFRLPQQ